MGRHKWILQQITTSEIWLHLVLHHDLGFSLGAWESSFSASILISNMNTESSLPGWLTANNIDVFSWLLQLSFSFRTWNTCWLEQSQALWCECPQYHLLCNGNPSLRVFLRPLQLFSRQIWCLWLVACGSAYYAAIQGSSSIKNRPKATNRLKVSSNAS